MNWLLQLPVVGLHLLLLVYAFLGVVGSTSATTSREKDEGSFLLQVDLRKEKEARNDAPTLVALQACAGLMNRDTKGGSPEKAYIIWDEKDADWLQEIFHFNGSSNQVRLLQVEEFLMHCMRTVAEGRYIHYDYASQQRLVPILVTLAGVLDAIPLVAPLQESLYGTSTRTRTRTSTGISTNSTRVFDATKTFQGFLEYDATAYMLQHYSHQTPGLSKMNPGYDYHKSSSNPPLTNMPQLRLVDYIVKQRLFNFYLKQGCVPMTKEHALMKQMVQPTQKQKEQMPTVPLWLSQEHSVIPVYGYDDVHIGPVDLYEAETFCVSHHHLGAVASDGASNLAFWSRTPNITQPLIQHVNTTLRGMPAQSMNDNTNNNTTATTTNNNTSTFSYNASKTYIAFVMGDGDNVAFMLDRNLKWVRQRTNHCLNATTTTTTTTTKHENNCFPISWTVSPHALYLMPEILQWFYQQANLTGRDSFLLPPSGYLYSYPAQIRDPQTQQDYIQRTEQAAYLLNTSGVVDWEFATTWPNAIHDYFPNYAAATAAGSSHSLRHKQQVVRGFFPVNVLFNLPVLAFRKHEFYKLIYPKNANNNDHKNEDNDDDNTKNKDDLDGVVILFRPREWRGTSGHGNFEGRVPFSAKENLNEQDMAAEINAYPTGTVTYIYLTSDGGLDLEALYTMVGYLEDHVEIVNHEVLIDMALQRSRSETERTKREAQKQWWKNSFLAEAFGLLWGI